MYFIKNRNIKKHTAIYTSLLCVHDLTSNLAHYRYGTLICFFRQKITQEGISCLFHLGQDHGRDLLREERLHLTLVFSLNLGFAKITDNLESQES